MLDWLREFLGQYGYWAVALILLLENMGIPVPGETTLLIASFLAYSEHRLQLPYIILVGICAATLGDNLGFVVGYFGGRPILDRYRATFRIRESTIARGEDLFARYGAATIFVARFIAGMRIIAGPLAGVLRMPWREFVLFNFLGAAVWVTAISLLGYLFGKHWATLVDILKDLNIAGVLAICAVLFLWWRKRRNKTDPG